MNWSYRVIPLLCAATACFGSPEYKGKACGPNDPCPTGFACSVARVCEAIASGGEEVLDAGDRKDAWINSPTQDAAVGQDADLASDPDAGTSDTVSFDAQPADASTADAAVDDAAVLDAQTPDATGFPDAAPIDSGPPDSGIIERTILLNSVEEDAMQDPGGPILMNHWWMSLFSDDHFGAARFQLAAVLPGTQILEARLQLYVESGNNDPNVRIHVQPTSSPASLTTATNDISVRPKSTEFVEWVAQDLPEGWAQIDVTTLVKSIVEKQTWVAHGHVMFIFDTLPPVTNVPGALDIRQHDYPSTPSGPRLYLRMIP